MNDLHDSRIPKQIQRKNSNVRIRGYLTLLELQTVPSPGSTAPSRPSPFSARASPPFSTRAPLPQFSTRAASIQIDPLQAIQIDGDAIWAFGFVRPSRVPELRRRRTRRRKGGRARAREEGLGDSGAALSLPLSFLFLSLFTCPLLQRGNKKETNRSKGADRTVTPVNGREWQGAKVCPKVSGTNLISRFLMAYS